MKAMIWWGVKYIFYILYSLLTQNGFGHHKVRDDHDYPNCTTFEQLFKT